MRTYKFIFEEPTSNHRIFTSKSGTVELSNIAKVKYSMENTRFVNISMEEYCFSKKSVVELASLFTAMANAMESDL